MSRGPGRPKSDDPKRALTIRVRASRLSRFADTKAARSAIEALVEARYAPGFRSELAKAIDGVSIIQKPIISAKPHDRFSAGFGPQRAKFGERLKTPKGGK